MKKTLIIKTGDTLPALAARKGDFENWILAGMDLPAQAALVVDVRQGADLPGLGGLAGVVITGSHDMVTWRLDWSERTAEWLARAVDHKIPVLGICYGHQLLAHALGGRVGNNPNGGEYGTVAVRLEEAANQQALFADLPATIGVQLSHKQSVLELPPGAVRLASSRLDANQAFVYAGTAWGVQFHPEFDAEVVKTYILHEREKLLAEGQDPDSLFEKTHDTPYGRLFLSRFAQLVYPATQGG